jgi:hypothetical protein
MGLQPIKVLSVDWDVFHDMTQFMPGAMSCQEDWIVEYSRWTGEWRVSYKFHEEEFQQLKAFLKTYNGRVHFAEDHQDLYHVMPFYRDIDLVHLDFHKDASPCESYNDLKGIVILDGYLDCGNWISALKRYKRCTFKKIDWRQLHSKHHGDDSILGGSPADMGLNITWSMGFQGVFQQQYDFVFVCQSWIYSPPHMGHRMRELQEVCSNLTMSTRSPLIFPSYDQRKEHWSGGRQGFVEPFYFPTGKESELEMDEIHDDHDNLVVHDRSTLDWLKVCDPLWYGEV